MEFFEALETRRSVRKFLDIDVPDSVIENALDAALKAPNSSNIQPWEFYWIKNKSIKDRLVEACFSQSAARTSKHLIFAVCRIDTWKRNRNILLEQLESQGKVPNGVLNYYNKVVPSSYVQGPMNVLYLIKKPLTMISGLFRPTPRAPGTRAELFSVGSKTTALACQNLMLSLVAQGYDSCPMEGYDEKRVKKILKLNRKTQVVMAIAIGKRNDKGVYGKQFRVPKELVIHKIE
jgi:nitroreductase